MIHRATALVTLSLASLNVCILAHDLVDVQKIIPTIRVDIRYATPDNFTGKKIYTSDRCYLKKEVAHALKQVQEELMQMGMSLKIWDGYHSVSSECVLQNTLRGMRSRIDHTPDPGKHTRGTSIDCTLVWTDTDEELKMPTLFDDFSLKSHRSCEGVSREAIANSIVLESVMIKHGFVGSLDEWWHFDYGNWQDKDPLDVQMN